MNYTSYKRDFIQQLATSGECSPNGVDSWLFNSIPERLRVKWTNDFYRTVRPAHVPATPRLLNHFKLGADPEFVIAVQSPGSAIALQHAEQFGLIAGLCVGADNNGRLVELRPSPSRFALEVVASILSELRWLALFKPKTAAFSWKAGAYSGSDGLGGHVHFGRKQAGKPEERLILNGRFVAGREICALDQLTRLLMASEVFDPLEMASRKGDHHGGIYGNFSDWRPQSHGYEFRTLPSWLNSPWLAYLSLTLAKLAVSDPEFFRLLPQQLSQAASRKWIRNTLARYKGLDDDARLASLGLDVWGLPKAGNYPFDFKPAWGLLPPQPDMRWRTPSYEPPTCLPPTVKPSPADLEDIFQLICFGKPISSWLPTAPTWAFQNPPNGFTAIQNCLSTRVAPGLGELLWDGLVPDGLPLTFSFLNKEHRGVYVPPEFVDLVDLKTLRKRFGNVEFATVRGPVRGLLFTKGLLTPWNMSYARQILYSGLFPVARFDNAASLEPKRIRKIFEAQALRRKSGSKVLFEG